MRIFGVLIDNLTHKEILARAETFLDEPKFHRIATVNPEFLLQAEKDVNFRKALLAADLLIADGFGIVLIGYLHGEHIHRFPGADLMEVILQMAERENLSVYLAIRKDGLSSYDEIKLALLKKYKNLKIEGLEFNQQEIENCKLPPPIQGPASAGKIENCAIILCNFGAPSQELFLARLKADCSSLRVAMGVGGSFDYLTGKQTRAPKWLRVIGLEWLWRLILQPKRWKRIWNAVIIFPIKIFTK